ncbi:hypothetical protein K469DRAFT_126527, partial [Zopfia rhizophila CBS 207.26]
MSRDLVLPRTLNYSSMAALCMVSRILATSSQRRQRSRKRRLRSLLVKRIRTNVTRRLISMTRLG